MNSINFNIFVTTSCNLNCKYCYENVKDLNVTMNSETVKSIISFICEKIINNDIQKVYITFHGGEPLLEIDTIDYIINDLDSFVIGKQIDIFYSLTTNLTLYNPSMLSVLKKINALSVSIDGRQESHDQNRVYKNGKGSYEIVIKNTKELLENKADITARMVVTSSTYEKIFENFLFLVSVGFRKFVIEMDFINFTWKNSQINEYIEQLKKIIRNCKQLKEEGIEVETGLIQDGFMKAKNAKCDGGVRTFSILPSGELYPCAISTNSKEFCMGIVGDKIDYGIVDIIQEYNNQKMKKCEGCGRYDYCESTRCRIVNKLLTGSYLEPSPVSCANQRISLELSKYAIDNSISVYNI